NIIKKERPFIQIMFKPVKHIKVSEEIVNQVKELIAQGLLKPGDRLPPERELVKVFGVSRPSLREALNSLITMGFLEIKGKRTFIKSIASGSIQEPISLILKADAQKIFDLIEVRKAMETWAAFHAAQKATHEDIQRLEKILQKMKIAFQERKSWEKEDADFHLAIAQSTHNPIQAHIMFSIHDLLSESVGKVFRDRAKVKRLIEQHERIFNAIKNHSPEKARERTLEHLNYVESEVKTYTANKH
ncbi:MAG: FadR/GntR family transcriptional regulator, partial [Thermodesulfobacteriota bacterium]